MKRIGVIGIVVKGNREVVPDMQKIFTEFSDIIIGRMGIPKDGISTIALIVEGSQERVSALTGKLGRLNELYVKSAMTGFEIIE